MSYSPLRQRKLLAGAEDARPGKPTLSSARPFSTSTLAAPFLGSPVEICIVTPSINRTIASLLDLGIGPFKLFTLSPLTCSSLMYHGKSVDFEMKVAFASPTPGSGSKVVWELIEPVSGPTMMRDFLKRNPQGGIQHIAFDCVQRRETRDRSQGDVVRGMDVEERKGAFRQRGYEVAMSGVWHGKRGTCEFMYFDTLEKGKGGVGTCFGSYDFSEDWEEPSGPWKGVEDSCVECEGSREQSVEATRQWVESQSLEQ